MSSCQAKCPPNRLCIHPSARRKRERRSPDAQNVSNIPGICHAKGGAAVCLRGKRSTSPPVRAKCGNIIACDSSGDQNNQSIRAL